MKEKTQTLYSIERGDQIKKLLKSPDYKFDDEIKNMSIDDSVLYGVRVTRLTDYGVFWPDEYRVDFVEVLPDEILNKINLAYRLKDEIESFKENRRLS